MHSQICSLRVLFLLSLQFSSLHSQFPTCSPAKDYNMKLYETPVFLKSVAVEMIEMKSMANNGEDGEKERRKHGLLFSYFAQGSFPTFISLFPGERQQKWVSEDEIKFVRSFVFDETIIIATTVRDVWLSVMRFSTGTTFQTLQRYTNHYHFIAFPLFSLALSKRKIFIFIINPYLCATFCMLNC